jgi:exopolysaccharide biosynthesis polyprenyl glycosylphosphotransferase
MTLILPLLEGILISAIVSLIAWTQEYTLWIHWGDAATAVGRGGILSLCCMVVFYYADLYDLRIVPNFSRYFSRLPKSLFFVLFPLIVFYTLSPMAEITPNPFISGFLTLLVITGFLLPLRAIFYAILGNKRFIKRALILGASPFAYQLIREIEAHPRSRYSTIGIVDDIVPSDNLPSRYPFLGSFKDLIKIIDETRPDRIIVALARSEDLPLRDLLQTRLHGVVVEDGVKVYERLTGKLAIDSLTPNSLIFSQDFNKRRLEIGLRRTFSLVLALPGLLLIFPLMVIIALAIKLDSEGPVFFVQERVGLRGRIFRLLKFRTMYPAQQQTSEWVRDNGHRITQIGKRLRKFRLDELPQLFNILRGDMDLVGPRPHPVSHYPLFVMVLRNASDYSGEAIPYYSLRCVIRPGVTGWAQVRYGYANDLEEEIEKMRYDLYYIKHMSLGLDLRIFLDTIKVALLGQGSEAANTAQHLPGSQDAVKSGRRSWESKSTVEK